MSHGHPLRREKPLLSDNHFHVHCRTHTESRRNLEIPNNLQNALGPNLDNNKTNIFFSINYLYI